MAEAAHICQLATSILHGHFTHPQYHRIGLPGIQGVEAVLTILQDCYGFSYPGGLFLAAVDVMLEKSPVVRAVKQQLQRCIEAASATQQQQQAQQQQHQQLAAEDGGECSSQQEPSCNSDGRSAGSSGWLLQEQDSGPDEQQQGPAAAIEHIDSAAAGETSTSPADVQQPWQFAAHPAASGGYASDQACSSRSNSKSPAGASTAFHTVSRSSTPATPTATGAGALGCSSPARAAAAAAAANASTPPALHDRDNPLLSPVSAASPLIQGQASRLAQQGAHQQQQQHHHGPNYQHQQQRAGITMESMQRHQHQQLQHLLFDAPSEVFTASLAGSMRQIDLSAVTSPQQIQAQQELQQELSRSSMASVGARPSRYHPQQQQQQEVQQEQQQQWESDPQAEQQPMLLQPQKAQEQQQLQQTLQFARQPVPLSHGQQQQLTSPESTWQQWQQQQQLAVTEPSPWRRQRELQQQDQQYPAASPLAVPQPKHQQPPLSPPLPPPHTASPAVTPLPGPLQQQQLLSTTPQSLPPQRAQNQQQQVPESTPAQQQGQQQNQQQEQQQQQQQQRGRSPQQLQELQDLAGILQPVLYDDAAASEVLSEWLSGSDVAVADSEAGSDAAPGPSSAPGSGAGFLGPGSGPFLQPPYMMAASLQQPSSAASTAGATMPPVVPTVLHFTPIAAGGAPGSWPGWVQGSSLYNSGERAGLQWAGASPEPAATASSAGPNTTPTAAARLQQQWSSQQRTPANTAAAAGGGGASGGGPSASQGPYRGAGSSSAAGRHSAASSSAVRGGGIPPAAAAGQQVGLSPGSSVAVRQAAAEEGDDGQSLVLDIDLAKVINSGSAAGTIVLQVRRDESGALTAAAALAPTPSAASGMQPGHVLATCGPLSASSPVLAGGKGPASRQGLPFGSISLEGSSSIGTACRQGSNQQQQRAGAAAAGGAAGEEVDRPVHRVLRYSAEGRISIGSFGPGSEATHGLVESLDFGPAVGPQQADSGSSRGVGSGERQHAQQWERDDELVCHLVRAAPRQRQLVDASWVLLDLQPSSQPVPDLPGTAASRVASLAHGVGSSQMLSAQQQQQQGQLEGSEHAAAATPAKGQGQAAGGWMPNQPPEVLAAQPGTAWPLQQQQQLLQQQGPRTQRVSLEPPSTPLAGSVAGTPPTSRQHPCGNLEGAGQSSLWVLSGDAATPLGGGSSTNVLQGLTGVVAEAATPAPAAASRSSMEQAAQGQGGVQAGGSDGHVSGADAATVSPLPPELLLTETPAGFKFWGAAGRAAAAAAGGGLRYNAAQQAMESFSSNLFNGGPAAAIAAGAELGAAGGAVGAHLQQQQQQLSLLGKSLELLGPDGAALLGQLGLGQISMDLLGTGQMRSLELQMLQAFSSAAAAAAASATAGPGDVAGAQQLAVNAVRLLRHSFAAAATAAAAARQSTAGLAPTTMQQLPTLAVREEAGGGLEAAAAAVEDVYGTRGYHSLDLLPRQLLQSLTAAALAEAGKQGWSGVKEGAGSQVGAGVHSQKGAGGSHLMRVEASPAVGAAVTPGGVHQQMQQQQLQQQPAGENCDGDGQQQQQQQQQGGAQEPTSWLADRFGSDAGLQQSVSVLLQELEQQQQTEQQQQHSLQQQEPLHQNHQQQQQPLQQDEAGQHSVAASAYASWSNRVEQLLQQTAYVQQHSPQPAAELADSQQQLLLPVLTEGSLRMTPSPSGYMYGPQAGSGLTAGAVAGVGDVGDHGCVGDGHAAGAVVALGEDSSLPSLFRTSVMTNPLYWVESSAADFEVDDGVPAVPVPVSGAVNEENGEAADCGVAAAAGGSGLYPAAADSLRVGDGGAAVPVGVAEERGEAAAADCGAAAGGGGGSLCPAEADSMGTGRAGAAADAVGMYPAAGGSMEASARAAAGGGGSGLYPAAANSMEARDAGADASEGRSGLHLPAADSMGARQAGAAFGGADSSLHLSAADSLGADGAGAAASRGGSSLHPAAGDSLGAREAGAAAAAADTLECDAAVAAVTGAAGAASPAEAECTMEAPVPSTEGPARSHVHTAGFLSPAAAAAVPTAEAAAGAAGAAEAAECDLAQQDSAQAAAVMRQYLPYSNSYSSSSSPCGSNSSSPTEKRAHQAQQEDGANLDLQQQLQVGCHQQQRWQEEVGRQQPWQEQAAAAAVLPAGPVCSPGSGHRQRDDAGRPHQHTQEQNSAASSAAAPTLQQVNSRATGAGAGELDVSSAAPAPTAAQQVGAPSTCRDDGAAVGLHAPRSNYAAAHSLLASPGSCNDMKQPQDQPDSPAASPTTRLVLYDSFCGVAAEETEEAAAARMAGVHEATSLSAGYSSRHGELGDEGAAGAAAAGGAGSIRGSSQRDSCSAGTPSRQDRQILLSEASAGSQPAQEQQWQQQSPRWQVVSEVQWIERLQEQPQLLLQQPGDEDESVPQEEDDCHEQLSEQHAQEEGSAVLPNQASSSCGSASKQQQMHWQQPGTDTVLQTEAQQRQGQQQQADPDIQWGGQQCEGQQWESQQQRADPHIQWDGQHFEGQHIEPQSVSRIQHLMQKLRNRRKVQHSTGADCSPLQDTTPAAAARDTESSASDAQQLCLERPIWRAPSPEPAVQASSATCGCDPASQAGMSPEQDSCSPASTSGWQPVSPDARNAAAVADGQLPAGPCLEAFPLHEEPRCASIGSPGPAGWDSVQPAEMRSASSSRRQHAASSNREPDAVNSAIDDTLSAAEAAMQQALQRIQLLQEGQQQQQHDHNGASLHSVDQQPCDQQQPQQQAVLVSAQMGAAVLYAPAGQLQHGHCHHQQEEEPSAAAKPTVATNIADDTTPQQQPSQQLVGVPAASSAAQHTAHAPAPQQQQADNAAAAVENPSLGWVRRVLQDSSALSSYVQALADNDHSSSQSRGAAVPGESAEWQNDGDGGAGACRHAAAASNPAVSPDSRSGQYSDTLAPAGFRQQIASRMSALLAAAHSTDLRDSHCSSSSSDGGDDILSSPGEAGEHHAGGSRVAAHSMAAAGQPQTGVWQDRIQQLLAAADAAADSLEQSPEIPQQQQQPTAAVRTKPPASGGAAAPDARPSAAARRAAAPSSSSLGLRRSGAASGTHSSTAAGTRSSAAAVSSRGPAGQAGGTSVKDGSRLAASAAAIVAARHSQSARAAQAESAPAPTRAENSRPQQRVPSSAKDLLRAGPDAPTDAASGAIRNSSQAAAKGRAAPSSAARPSKLQKLAGSERAAAVAVASDGIRSTASCPAGAILARGTSSNSIRQLGAQHEAPAAAARGGAAGAGALVGTLHGAGGCTTLRGQDPAAGQQVRSVTLQHAVQQQPHAASTGQPAGQSSNKASATIQQQQQMVAPAAAAGQPRDIPPHTAAAPASRQQLEQLQRVNQRHMQQHLAEAAANSRTSTTCPDGGGVRAVSTAGSQQVRPEDSAVMHAGPAGKAAGSASRTAKLRQQANSVLGPLLAPESSVIAAAPVVVSTLGTAAGAAAVQQVVVQKCSMFDIMQPKGYTFNTAKARATAELATATAAEQEPTTQQAQGNSASTKVTHSQGQADKPAGQQTQANSTGKGRQPGAAAAAASCAADFERGTSTHTRPQAGIRAAVAATQEGASMSGSTAAAGWSQPRYKQQAAAAAVHGQYTDALQQQDSISSQRSHGLSLRRSARQPSPADESPAPAAPTAATAVPLPASRVSPQRQQQQRQQGQGQQSQSQQQQGRHSYPYQQRQGQQQERQGQQQQQQRYGQQPAGHSVVTVRSSTDTSPVSGRTLQLQALAAKRRADAAAKVGSSSAGSVAAVAAVKAALAGFGTKGWQQQDVCEWLSRMRLDLLPEEPSQPLLLNPLRNGLLLAGIAAALTLQPLSGIFQPVSTLAAARANLLAAAARLGMVSTRFACSAAAAAARRDKEEALGMQGSSDSRPCLWVVKDPPGSQFGQRGPTRGVVGLRSPVRCAGVRGSSAASSPVRQSCRSRSASPNRCYSYQRAGGYPARPGSGGNGLVLDPGSTCACFVVAATGPAGVQGIMGDGGSSQHLPGGQHYHQHQYQQQQQQLVGLCGPASSCCCCCWACQQLEGTVLEHAVLQLLELVMAGDTSCMWGLLYALQQAFPVVPDHPRMCSPARRQLSPCRQPVRPQQQQQQQAVQEGRGPGRQGGAGAAATAAAARGGGGAGGLLSSSGACTVVQPLQGPSWRTFQLPYTAAELKELEQQLLQWLGSLDLISVTDTPDWSCLSHDIASGVLLAEVAAAVGAGPAVGIQERPVTAAARAGNIQAVLDVLQQLPGLQCRRLLQQHEAALLAGERPALTALLEAVWVWATGQQHSGPWLRWTDQQQQQQARSRGSCSMPDRGTRSSSNSRGRAGANRAGASSNTALGQMRP